MSEYEGDTEEWYATRHAYWQEVRSALVRAVGFGERIQDIITEKCGKEVGARFAQMRRHIEAASHLAERGARTLSEDRYLQKHRDGPPTVSGYFENTCCDGEGNLKFGAFGGAK